MAVIYIDIESPMPAMCGGMACDFGTSALPTVSVPVNGSGFLTTPMQLSSDVSASGGLLLKSAMPLPPLRSERQLVTLPVSVGGTLVLRPTESVDSPEVFADVRGLGTATLFMARNDVGELFTSLQSFEFADSAPVPEPGSLMLLLSGGVVLARQMRRIRTAA